MGFTDRFNNAIRAFNTKSLGNSVSGSVTRNYFNGHNSPEHNFKGLAYKVVDKIGQSVSKYEPKVYRGDSYLETHPFYTLHNAPNPDQKTGAYFNHLWAMLDEIYGKTFWYIVRGENSRKIKELYLLDPSRMQVHREDGIIVGYTLNKYNGEQIPFTPDEIYFDRTPNPFNPDEGLSAYDKASTYIEIEGITADFTLSYMKNNASPSGIVSLPNMDRNLFQKFVAQWRENYEGASNAGKTAFIRGGEASFKAVGATLKDIDQKVTRDMAKEDVLAMFEMPKAMLGIGDQTGLGRASVETLDFIYSKEKLEPKLNRLDSIYTNIWLAQPSEANSKVIIEHDSVIPEDKEYKLALYEKLTGVVLTPNEVRAELGLEPIADGNTLSKNTQPAVAPVSPAKSAKVTLKKKLTKAELIAKEIDSKEKYRSDLFKVNDYYEKKMLNVMVDFLNKQQAIVIGKINATSKAFDEWLFDIDDANKTLTGTLAPVVDELMDAQAEGVANFISKEPLIMTPEIREMVRHEIGEIVGNFNQDTRAKLETSLTEGNSKGESLAKLKKRVTADFEEAKGYRAKRIAQTESARATNITAEMSYKANGYSKKEWFANPNACQFCRGLDGKVIEIGSKYATTGGTIEGADGGILSVDYRDVQNPPIHPNCKCSINPVV